MPLGDMVCFDLRITVIGSPHFSPLPFSIFRSLFGNVQALYNY
jgi:hypothetical protein